MKLPQEFDLHALEVFVMTVELGGMSQCAAHLQVTQSAVSQTIAKLDAAIGPDGQRQVAVCARTKADCPRQTGL